MDETPEKVVTPEIVKGDLKTPKKQVSEKWAKYLREGGPGRPPGLKNKFTELKRTLLDTFNKHKDKRAALERTLFYIKQEDGLEYVNIEALRAILSTLPKEAAIDLDVSVGPRVIIHMPDEKQEGKP